MVLMVDGNPEPKDEEAEKKKAAKEALRSRNRPKSGLFCFHEHLEVEGLVYRVTYWNAIEGKLRLKRDKDIKSGIPTEPKDTVELKSTTFRIKRREPEKGRLFLKELRGNATVNVVPEELLKPEPEEPDTSVEEAMVALATESTKEQKTELENMVDDLTAPPKPEATFDPARISLCPLCYCMTHTLSDGTCGKCKKAKPTEDAK